MQEQAADLGWLSQLLLGQQQSTHLTLLNEPFFPTPLAARGTSKLLNTPTNKHFEQAGFSSAVRTPVGAQVLTKEIRYVLIDTQAKLE